MDAPVPIAEPDTHADTTVRGVADVVGLATRDAAGEAETEGDALADVVVDVLAVTRGDALAGAVANAEREMDGEPLMESDGVSERDADADAVLEVERQSVGVGVMDVVDDVEPHVVADAEPHADGAGDAESAPVCDRVPLIRAEPVGARAVDVMQTLEEAVVETVDVVDIEKEPVADGAALALPASVAVTAPSVGETVVVDDADASEADDDGELVTESDDESDGVDETHIVVLADAVVVDERQSVAEDDGDGAGDCVPSASEALDESDGVPLAAGDALARDAEADAEPLSVTHTVCVGDGVERGGVAEPHVEGEAEGLPVVDRLADVVSDAHEVAEADTESEPFAVREMLAVGVDVAERQSEGDVVLDVDALCETESDVLDDGVAERDTAPVGVACEAETDGDGDADDGALGDGDADATLGEGSGVDELEGEMAAVGLSLSCALALALALDENEPDGEPLEERERQLLVEADTEALAEAHEEVVRDGRGETELDALAEIWVLALAAPPLGDTDSEGEPLEERERQLVTEAETEALAEAHGEAVRDGLVVGDRVAQTEAEVVALAARPLGETDKDGVSVALPVADALTDAEPERDALTEPDADLDAAGDRDALVDVEKLAVDETVGVCELPRSDAAAVDVSDGDADMDGVDVGARAEPLAQPEVDTDALTLGLGVCEREARGERDGLTDADAAGVLLCEPDASGVSEGVVVRDGELDGDEVAAGAVGVGPAPRVDVDETEAEAVEVPDGLWRAVADMEPVTVAVGAATVAEADSDAVPLALLHAVDLGDVDGEPDGESVGVPLTVSVGTALAVLVSEMLDESVIVAELDADGEREVGPDGEGDADADGERVGEPLGGGERDPEGERVDERERAGDADADGLREGAPVADDERETRPRLDDGDGESDGDGVPERDAVCVRETPGVSDAVGEALAAREALVEPDGEPLPRAAVGDAEPESEDDGEREGDDESERETPPVALARGDAEGEREPDGDGLDDGETEGDELPEAERLARPDFVPVMDGVMVRV